MIPLFLKNDLAMFQKYLQKAKIYFEYGCGGSTFQASRRLNIEKVSTVESDLFWLNKVKETSNEKINFIYCDLKTLPNTWGNPGKESKLEDWKLYSDALSLNNSNPDLILIDGRFRVCCCLKAFRLISNDCIICFDDFLNRPEYKVVLDYFTIKEKTCDNRMVILTKKNCEAPPLSLIEEFEKISK